MVNIKIVFEINSRIFVKIESRLSLVKKGINIVEGVCDIRYTGNIIIQLQNTTNDNIILQKYDKITQAIFLLLVSIDRLQ
jgi:dUTPase